MCKRSVCVSLLLLSLGLVQAKEIVWQKAAYWDSRYNTNWVNAANALAVRDGLQAAGYTILNADELKTWMTARIADKAFSVVVNCHDTMPMTVTETMSATCTLRKYLDAGGKIVWFGDIPFYRSTTADGAYTTTGWGDAGAAAILGFNTAGAARDSGNTCTITPLGKTWGLTATWTTARPAALAALLPADVLATDSAGNACAWVKHYVPGDTFRGFVRFRDASGQPDIGDVIRVAEYVAVKASNPTPANGANSVTMALLQWAPGPFVLWHDVYLGTKPELTDADRQGRLPLPQTAYYYMQGLTPGTTYYWRVDEVDADGTVFQGDVWSFMAAPVAAWSPSPASGAAYVVANPTLTWTAGMNAVTHDVYFGLDRAAVESGAAAAKVATKQPAALYTPAALERGKTYYWRVDENAIAGVVPGPVWSFSTRPVVAKTDPNLVGWWKMDDEKAGVAVDYSGYDNYGALIGGPKFVDGYLGDALSFDGVDDYVNCGSDPSLRQVGSVSVAAWVKPGKVSADMKIASDQSGAGYKLGLYSANNMVEFEIRTAANVAILNRTAPGGTALQKDVWYHVVGVYNKGKSIRTYVNGVLDRDYATAEVAGVSTGALMLGREAPAGAYWWLGLMDDVRVYNKALTDDEVKKAMQGDPLIAYAPQPMTGVNADIRDVADLQWSAGEGAAKHDMYFGQDRDAVRAADTTSALYRGRQADPSFSLAGLVEMGGGTYFWRIDEVEADGKTIHKGVIWSFTVPAYLIVDEFENYNATDNRIYDTWWDGWADKSSGSTVGYIDAVNGTFGETTIVHGGRQSMPFDYNNINTPYYSEAVREFAPLQNWTAEDVNALTLWVQGYPALTPAPFTDAGGKISLTGSGTDIWNNSDQFSFAYKTLTGDGTIVARVVSPGTGTNGWAKGGVMIRDSLDGGSTFVDNVITGTANSSYGNGAAFQYRLTPNGACAGVSPTAVVAPPYWVKLQRQGDTLTASLSADGKTWALLGTPQTITMSGPVYVGLCVTAHVAGEQRTYQFDNVTTTGSVSGAWQAVVITSPRYNDTANFYVAVEDSAGKVASVSNPTLVNAATWTAWKIPLSNLTGVNLSKVKKMYLGVGDRKAPVPDGTGRIFLDDIQLTK